MRDNISKRVDDACEDRRGSADRRAKGEISAGYAGCCSLSGLLHLVLCVLSGDFVDPWGFSVDSDGRWMEVIG